MTLTVNTRFAILGLVFSIAVGAFLTNQIAIKIENTGFDINKEDIYFFENDYVARYNYENGYLNGATTLDLNARVINETHTNVTIQHDTSSSSFLAHPNGTVYQGGTMQGNYSIWWIYIKNQLMMLGVETGATYDVVDPTGFLGIPGRAYVLVVDRRLTYWPFEPELMGLSGAQASIFCTLWDKTSERLISQLVIDVTCGIVETWEGAQDSFIKLKMLETSFPISRNRFVILGVAPIFVAIFCVLIFLIFKYNKKAASLQPEQREEIVTLYAFGASAIILEIIDIWFYLYPGYIGMLLLHVAFTVAAAIICWRRKYAYRWCIPSILEIAFVFSLSAFTGDPFVPPLTAFMGSTITWFCLLWASGITMNVDDDLRGIKKWLSRIT